MGIALLSVQLLVGSGVLIRQDSNYVVSADWSDKLATRPRALRIYPQRRCERDRRRVCTRERKQGRSETLAATRP